MGLSAPLFLSPALSPVGKAREPPRLVSMTMTASSLPNPSRALAIARADTGSRCAAGSSSNRTRGFIARTAASATRCFSPPESSLNRLPERCDAQARLRAFADRRWISPTERPRFSGPKATSSSTVMVQNWPSGSCWTSPTDWAISNTSARAGFRPRTLSSPRVLASMNPGMKPVMQCAKVDLPEPVAPVISTRSPWRTVRLTLSSAGCSRPVPDAQVR